MPRIKSNIWNHFDSIFINSKTFVLCQYCGAKYVPNATKMKKHLISCKNKDSFYQHDEYGENEIQESKFNMNGTKPNMKCLPSTSSGSSQSSEGFIPKSLDSKIDSYNDSLGMETAQGPSSLNKTPKTVTTPSSNTVDLRNFMGEKTKIDNYLVRAIFSSGSSLRIVEDPMFKQFINLLNPSYVLPSRKKILTTLLNNEYKKLQKVIKNKINNTKNLILMSGGWTDISENSIINIIFATPEPVFIKCVQSKKDVHTEKYLANLFLTEINAVGPEKVSAIVTDNAANMHAASNIIKETYPHLITFQCFAHSFNLLVKELAKIKPICESLSVAKDIIQYFNNKHVPKAILKKIQSDRDRSPTTLKMAVDTKSNTYYIMLDSLIKNKTNLQEACLDKDLVYTISLKIKKYILDESNYYWEQLDASKKILEPLAEAIKALEEEKPSLAHVRKHLKRIEQKITEYSSLFPNHVNNILDCLQAGMKPLTHPVLLAAEFLHPNCHTQNLTDKEVIEAINFISTIGVSYQMDECKILVELAEYRSKNGEFANPLFWKVVDQIIPETWWNGFFQHKTLCRLATLLLAIPPISASCVKSFKYLTNMETKTRNRLLIDSAEKIMFLKHNLKLITDIDELNNIEPECDDASTTQQEVVLIEEDNDLCDSDCSLDYTEMEMQLEDTAVQIMDFSEEFQDQPEPEPNNKPNAGLIGGHKITVVDVSKLS